MILSSSLALTITILAVVLAAFLVVIVYLAYRKSKGHRLTEDEDPKEERKYLRLRYKGEKKRQQKKVLKKKRQLERRDKKESNKKADN